MFPPPGIFIRQKPPHTEEDVGTGCGPMAFVAYGGLQHLTALGCGHEAGGLLPAWDTTSPHAEE